MRRAVDWCPVLISVVVCCGCAGGGAPKSGTPPVPAGSYAGTEVKAEAEELYAAWEAGGDLGPMVRDVLQGFGIALVNATGSDMLAARLAAGQPTLIEPQVAELKRAYDEGVFISVDSFVAGINERGATIEKTGAPVTRAFLGELLGAVESKAVLGPGETLSALVLALGRARSAHSTRPILDPIWGDGRLDPLQTILLLFAVNYSGNSHFARPAGAALTIAPVLASGLGDQVGGYVEGQVEEALEMPITPDGAGKASLCSSLLLYGHHMKVTAAPSLIYHRQTDGDAPSSSTITAQLRFQDDYWDNYAPIDRSLLEAAGCTLPRRGTVPGAAVGWTLGDDLVEHGMFDLVQTMTDDGGDAKATFRTVLERTPKPKRTFENQRNVTDAVIVQATGLVSGWSSLEWVVVNLRPVGSQGSGFLSVNWYEGAAGWAGSVDYTVAGMSSVDTPGTNPALNQTMNTTMKVSGHGRVEMAESMPGNLAPSTSSGDWTESRSTNSHLSYTQGACTEESTGSTTVELSGMASPPTSDTSLVVSGDTYQIQFQTLPGSLAGTQTIHTAFTATPACNKGPGGADDSMGPATGMFPNVVLDFGGTIDPTKPTSLQGSKMFPMPGVPPRIYTVTWNLTQK
jgi:hypothetical protein